MNQRIIPHSKPTIGIEEEGEVIKVIRSNHIVQGAKVKEFEGILAQILERKHSIAVNSGISSLHLALLALGIHHGDEVILPSYTCDALLNAIMYTGATPIIVDVDYFDGNISPEKCHEAINKNTKAIIVPHSLGFPAKIDKIKEFSIPVIEDCAVSLGGMYKGKMLGSYGDIAVGSFYGTKMITTGEGGIVLTDNEEYSNNILDLRDYTGNTEYRIRYNYKMNDIEAAIGVCQVKKLQSFVEVRKSLYEKYVELIGTRNDIIVNEVGKEEGTMPAYYRFIAKIPNKDTFAIIKRLKEKGIYCGKGVLQPLHRLLKLKDEQYPISNKLCSEVISLPLYPSLSEDDLTYVVENLFKVLDEF